MPTTRATRLVQALACLLPILADCLPAVAAERSPPDIVLFKARLASFALPPEGNPRCDARFPAGPTGLSCAPILCLPWSD